MIAAPSRYLHQPFDGFNGTWYPPPRYLYQTLDDFNGTRCLPPRSRVVHGHDSSLLVRPWRRVRIGPALRHTGRVEEDTPEFRAVARDSLEQLLDLALDKPHQLRSPLGRGQLDVPPRGHNAAHQRLAADLVDDLPREHPPKRAGRVLHVLQVEQDAHLDEHHAGGMAKLEPGAGPEALGRLQDVGAPDVKVRLVHVALVEVVPLVHGGPPLDEVVALLVPAEAEVQRRHDLAQALAVAAAQAEHVGHVVQGRPHGVGVVEMPERVVDDGAARLHVVAPEVTNVVLEEVGASVEAALLLGVQRVFLASQGGEGLPDVGARVLVAVAVAGLVLTAAVEDDLAAAATLQAGACVADLTLAWLKSEC